MKPALPFLSIPILALCGVFAALSGPPPAAASGLTMSNFDNEKEKDKDKEKDKSGKDTEKHSDAYRNGQTALSEERWEEASRIFASVIDEARRSGSGDTTDVAAALYWKAYADAKLSRKKDAIEGIRDLVSSYPRSAWVNDAKALELELRGGKANVEPDAVNDEELKLYALDSLMQVKPERAVPVLEKILAGDQSLKIKKRALFVLSQSNSAKAREILVRTVRTGQPLELRIEAVHTLGIAGSTEDMATLADLSRDPSSPREVRLALVEAYQIADRDKELLAFAKSDPDPTIRRKAIESLGVMDALPALRELWDTEKDPELRQRLLDSFGIAGDVATLAKIAREDKDPAIRGKAIDGIGVAGGPAASEALRQLYAALADTQDRRKVLEALMIEDDAKTLIALFKVEKDPALKKEIVQKLSMLDDPAATDLLMSILGEKP